MTAAERGGEDRLARTQAFWDSLTGEEGEFARQDDYGRAMWTAAAQLG